MKKLFALMFAALLTMSATTSAETIQATGFGVGPAGANPKSNFYKTYARYPRMSPQRKKMSGKSARLNLMIFEIRLENVQLSD